MAYQIESVKDVRWDELVGLHARGFRCDPALSASYLSWKYHSNPYFAQPLIYAVVHEDRVVGMRGAYGSRWIDGESGETSLLPCFGDLVIDPAHQNRGLFRQIMEFALRDLRERGFEYALSLSAGRVALLSSIATGWNVIGDTELQTREQVGSRPRRRLGAAMREAAKPIQRLGGGRTPSLARQRLSRVARRLAEGAVGHAFSEFDRHSARQARSGNSAGSDTPRCAEMAELVERLDVVGGLTHVRDTEYIRWRYKDPRSRYRFVYSEGDRLDGFLVLGSVRGTDVVSIVDWEASNQRAEETLLSSALEWGNFTVTQTWTVGLADQKSDLLRRSGFRPSSGRASGSAILVSATQSDADVNDWRLSGKRIVEPQNWDFRMIYSDAG